MTESNRSNILFLNPFHTGSHRQWAESLIRNSRHNFHLITLPGRNWKWRMHGAAVHFAGETSDLSFKPDIILSTDMMDLSTFRAMAHPRFPDARYICYFHENQISYPWSPSDEDVKLKRDYHYAFINYTTALAADKLLFNSQYHLNSFIQGLREMLGHFPDFTDLQTVELIKSKSEVLYLGLDLTGPAIEQHIEAADKINIPVLLWNHRWEYDKDPDLFFKTLFELKEEGLEFKVIITGESFSNSPAIFHEAKTRLKDQIIHFGYCKSRSAYLELLSQADIIPVTSNQDFFGGSIIEAINAGVIPLLPDRLAYPEHIPGHLHKKYIYKATPSFKSSLSEIIRNTPDFKMDLPEIKDHIKRYDWKNIINQYDRILSI